MKEDQNSQPAVLSSEEIFEGKIFSVTVDTVREDGKNRRREVVHHPGGATVIPVFEDHTIALVRQYRHPVGRRLIELPAGKRSPGEDPETCALRELEEEVGIKAERIEKLTEFYTSPGFCDEKLWLYIATDLSVSESQPEDDESLEIERTTFEHAFEMIRSGEIEDAKTIIGLTLAAWRLGLFHSEVHYPAV